MFVGQFVAIGRVAREWSPQEKHKHCLSWRPVKLKTQIPVEQQQVRTQICADRNSDTQRRADARSIASQQGK